MSFMFDTGSLQSQWLTIVKLRRCKATTKAKLKQHCRNEPEPYLGP